MKKILTGLLVTSLMLTAFFTFSVPVAAEDTFDPYAEAPTISTADDYVAFFNAVYNQKIDFAGKTITLLEDIVLNDTTVENWYAQPDTVKLTGINDYWAWFKGTFDGGNHTVKGMNVEGTFRMNDVPCGIFPYAMDATIKNVTYDGFYVCSTNTTVEASYGNGGAGGLIGHAKTEVTVDNVTLKNGTVTCVAGGKGALGALIGAYDGQKEGQTLSVTNCTVEESVRVIPNENSSVLMGGLIGYVHENFLSHPTNIDLSASRIQPAGSTDEGMTLKPFGQFRAGGNAGDNKFAWTLKNSSTDFTQRIEMIGGTDYTDTYNTAVLDSKCYGSSYSDLASYTVTWSVDGIETAEEYPQGAVPSYKGSLEKPMTDTHLYVFKEWSPAIEPVSADITYTAIYDEFAKVAVTWVVEGETTVEYYIEGVTPNYKGETNKEADDNFIYIFKGWDKEIKAATEDVTYTAQYESKAKYKITWVIDGETVEEIYLAGVKPSYKGKVEKVADDEYTYKFTGWDKEIVAACEDAVYTAQFEKTAKNPTATTTETPGSAPKDGCKSSVSAGFAILVMTIGVAGALAVHRKED